MIKNLLFNEEWAEALQNEWGEQYWQKLEKFLAEQSDVTPDKIDIFKAFNLTPLSTVKVVIIGQDPYPEAHVAHGLAFSSKQKNIPASLRNIYKELKANLGIENTSPNLMKWTNQGVLLLNRILTTKIGTPLAHKEKGWEIFTNKVMELLNRQPRPIIFVLWGKKAQELEKFITNKYHIILKSAHPSPYSAKQFWGNKHFKQINEELIKMGLKPINFQL